MTLTLPAVPPTPATLYDFAATTPLGRRAVFSVRQGTNDQSTVQAAVTEDEYGLAELDLGDGVAVDVGAHVGSVAIALALDHPEARIIAVEAVPANAELCRLNAERNGVSDRVTVLERAGASWPGRIAVNWNYSGSESADHHRFIGNSTISTASNHDRIKVRGVTLAQLVAEAGGSVAFLKADCEGCEYGLLDSPAVKDVTLIAGEQHRGMAGIHALLDKTHWVTGENKGVGHFAAVRRG